MQRILATLTRDKSGKIVMQPYLRTNRLIPSEKQTLFELRSFGLPLKSNQKSQYKEDMKCQVCLAEDSYEDEEHIFFLCHILLEDIEVDSSIRFSDIFDDLEHQIKAVKYFTKIIRRRKIILEMRHKETAPDILTQPQI